MLASALVVALAGCGSGGTSADNAEAADALGPTGYGAIRLGAHLDAVRERAAFAIKTDGGAFAPCGNYYAPTRRVGGLTDDLQVRTVGGTDRSVATDRGLRIGMTIEAARSRYGAPASVTSAPYNREGTSVLWRIGTLDGSAVWLHVITRDGRAITAVEVGLKPEIEYEEGCA